MSSRSWSISSSVKGRKTWVTTLPTGEERSYVLYTLLLPGRPSSSHSCLGSNEQTPISCLVNTTHLDFLRAAVPDISRSISRELQPIQHDAQLHEVRRTEHKGHGVFAKQSIEEGQLIVWEHPAIILPSTDREFAIEIYEDLGNATASADDKESNALWQRRRGEAISMANEYHGTPWVEGVVRTNAVVLELIRDNGVGLKARKRRDRLPDERVEKDIYGGIYPLINRANHSCAPNATVKWDRSTLSLSLYALKDIKKGEEIFKTYVNPLLPRATRMKTLHKNYKFVCDCPHCNVGGGPGVPLNSQDSTGFNLDAPMTDAQTALIAQSDANREQLATWIFTQPTYKKWSTDLCRADNLFINSHLDALAMIKKEGVYALQSLFMEEIAMAYAILGDEAEFRRWGEKVMKLNRVEDPNLSRQFHDWLEDPVKRVKRWGWRKRMKEESNRRRTKLKEDIDIGLLFEPIESEEE